MDTCKKCGSSMIEELWDYRKDISKNKGRCKTCGFEWKMKIPVNNIISKELSND